MTRIYYRFPDQDGRPTMHDDAPTVEVESVCNEIRAAGGVVVETRVLGWREQLSAMENSAAL